MRYSKEDNVADFEECDFLGLSSMSRILDFFDELALTYEDVLEDLDFQELDHTFDSC